MSIGINWAEVWEANVWDAVWQQEVQASTDTTDGLPKTEEWIHEPGVKPRQEKPKPVPSILTPKAKPPVETPDEREIPTKKRKKREPAFEVEELQVSPQFGTTPEISVAPILECNVSLSFGADPRFSVEAQSEYLDDAVAIAIGHPELALQIGDFLPVVEFDKSRIMGYDLV